MPQDAGRAAADEGSDGAASDRDAPGLLGGGPAPALTSAAGGPVKREIEHRWRELGEYLRDQRRLGQLSLRRLSELSGISNPYLSQIERGLRRPSAGILQQLARALHISAETLYVRAGMLDDERGGPADDLVDAIRRSSDLDDDHKRTLIHVYESFRAERATRLERARAEWPPRAERSRARGRRANETSDRLDARESRSEIGG